MTSIGNNVSTTITKVDYVQRQVEALENATETCRRQRLKDWPKFRPTICTKIKSGITLAVGLEEWNIRYQLIQRLKALSNLVLQVDGEFKTQNTQHILPQLLVKTQTSSGPRIQISQTRLPNGQMVALSVFQNNQQSKQLLEQSTNASTILPTLVNIVSKGQTVSVNETAQVNTIQGIYYQSGEDKKLAMEQNNITQANQTIINSEMKQQSLREVESESELKSISPLSTDKENTMQFSQIDASNDSFSDPEVSLNENIPPLVKSESSDSVQSNCNAKLSDTSNAMTILLYGCSYSNCHKTFKQTDTLERHMKTHLSDYVCSHEQCDKRFSTAAQLERHQKGHAVVTCTQCSKTFKSTSILRRHELTHLTESEKQHCCSTCSKRYATATQLTRHQQSHLATKQFRCSHCSKQYLSQYNLRKHIKKQHPSAELEIEASASVEMPSSEDGDTCDSNFENLSQIEFGENNGENANIETAIETVEFIQEPFSSDANTILHEQSMNITRSTEPKLSNEVEMGCIVNSIES